MRNSPDKVPEPATAGGVCPTHAKSRAASRARHGRAAGAATAARDHVLLAERPCFLERGTKTSAEPKICPLTSLTVTLRWFVFFAVLPSHVAPAGAPHTNPRRLTTLKSQARERRDGNRGMAVGASSESRDTCHFGRARDPQGVPGTKRPVMVQIFKLQVQISYYDYDYVYVQAFPYTTKSS